VKEVNLGLIGLGSMGKIHLLNCLNLDNAKLTAVSDISKKATTFAKKIGIKNIYNEYQQLLNDDNIDAVIIALPTHLHAPCAKRAAEAGRHILLEKPLSRNVKEGKDIVLTAKKNNIKLMIGYYLRFAAPFQILKEKINSGEIGDIQLANANYLVTGPFFHRAERNIPRPVPEWWFNRKLTGGGALIDLGGHMINLLCWYFGEISNVKTYLGYKFNLDLEDHAVCMLKFQTGQIATFNVGWFSQEMQIDVNLHGTIGNAHAAHKPSSKVKTGIQLMMRKTPDFQKPYLRELSHFIKCIKEDTLPSPSGEEALNDLEIISRAYKNQIELN